MADGQRSILGALGGLAQSMRQKLVDVGGGYWAPQVAATALDASGTAVAALPPGRANASASVPVVVSNEDQRNARPSSNFRQLTATADQNPVLISASARALHYVRGRKVTANSCFLKIYDKATVGASTDTPIATIELIATATFDLDFKGLPLVNGLSFRITGAIADNDTTNLTAGDVTGLNIGWAT